jgi:hypothetical protein
VPTVGNLLVHADAVRPDADVYSVLVVLIGLVYEKATDDQYDGNQGDEQVSICHWNNPDGQMARQ